MRKYRIGFMCLLATLLVVFVAGCGQETVTLPSVVSVTPAQGSANVAVSTTITATFNETMSSASISATTFTVTAPGGAAVTGTVSYSGGVATFTPGAALAYGATYTAAITKGAMTPAGVALLGNYVWSFTTIAPSIPAVASVTPAAGAVNGAVNAPITATFSMAMSPASVNGTTTFTVAAPGGVAVPGSAALNGAGTLATFTPTSGTLAYSTTYTATITTAATSVGGNPIAANYVWTFTTITPPPLVVSTVPVNTATGVPITQALTATFNEALKCATLTSPATSFTLTGPGATSVTGTVACAGAVATFTPGSSLAYNTVYTATIGTAAQSLAGTPLAAAYVWTFRTVSAAPPTPTVIATVPLNGSVGVPINQVLTATFNVAMNPATIVATTFTLKVTTGGAAVNGVVTYAASGSVATFTPNVSLIPSTNYTATITSGALDLNSDAGVAAYSWTFTTAATSLAVAPTVIVTNPVTAPENGSVPLNQIVSATFSESMNPTTINAATFTLTGPGVTPVAGLVAYAAIGKQLVFQPSSNLAPSTTFTATITTGVQSLTGVAMASSYSWIFKTGTVLNNTLPLLVTTVPASGASGVPLNQTVSATFSEAMNPLTLTNATFQLTQGGNPLSGTIIYDPVNFVATLTPTNPFTTNTTYVATVTSGATDMAGNPLGSGGPPNPWNFQTGTTLIVPPVVLGPTIAVYGGFGGSSGMTNQGIHTVINGNIGTTGASTTMTGFHDTSLPIVGAVWPCTYTETTLNIGQVNGVIDTGLPPPTINCPLEGTTITLGIATEAMSEAQTAYNTLQCNCFPGTGTAPPGNTLAGELGGLTIYPGVYTNHTTVGITNGDLTLDAQGDPNASWVFQIGSSLTVGLAGQPRNVILANGAKSGNIYWAVGSSATINGAGGGTFNGTIISQAGISVSTAGVAAVTTINGRLLGLTASTTLVNTVINVPAQ